MQLKRWSLTAAAHQEGTETVEAEKVEDSKVGPAGVLLSWQKVRLGVALLPIHRSHHDLLPSLSSGTSGYVKSDHGSIFATSHILTDDPGSQTHRNNIRTAWGNVWKLLLRLIWVPSTKAIFPKIWWVVVIPVKIQNTGTCLSSILRRNILTIYRGLQRFNPENKYWSLYLHPDDRVDKEEHHD